MWNTSVRDSLLLGCANVRGDPGDFHFEDYPYKRFRSIQTEVSKFWKKWCQLAGPNLFVRSIWHTRERKIVWLADQNALRGQYKLARVISVKDKEGIVRDVNVRTFPSYPVPVRRRTKEGATDRNGKSTKRLLVYIPSTILHRDVRRLVILIPVEKQPETEKTVTSLCPVTKRLSGRCKDRGENGKKKEEE